MIDWLNDADHLQSIAIIMLALAFLIHVQSGRRP